MRLEKYGETNEGKDLLLAIISSPQNMSRIEEIRKNNLRLAGIEKGNVFISSCIIFIFESGVAEFQTILVVKIIPAFFL